MSVKTAIKKQMGLRKEAHLSFTGEKSVVENFWGEAGMANKPQSPEAVFTESF